MGVGVAVAVFVGVRVGVAVGAGEGVGGGDGVEVGVRVGRAVGARAGVSAAPALARAGAEATTSVTAIDASNSTAGRPPQADKLRSPATNNVHLSMSQCPIALTYGSASKGPLSSDDRTVTVLRLPLFVLGHLTERVSMDVPRVVDGHDHQRCGHYARKVWRLDVESATFGTRALCAPACDGTDKR